jgi:hypothetical protein
MKGVESEEHRMADKELSFRCAYCHKLTQVVVEVSTPHNSRQGKKIPIVEYCEHCDEPNSVNVPDNWDLDSPVLGDHGTSPDNNEDTPIIQGEKL